MENTATETEVIDLTTPSASPSGVIPVPAGAEDRTQPRVLYLSRDHDYLKKEEGIQRTDFEVRPR